MLGLIVALTVSQAPAISEPAKPEEGPVLRGFDLALTVFNSSGVYFGPEGYSDTFTLWIEPSFAFGKTFFKGSWFEKLSLSARIPLEMELIGNDAHFRGTGFASPALFSSPEQVPILEAQRNIDGAQHVPVVMDDAWFSLSHGHLFTVPLLGIDVSSAIRTVLPTSTASRNAGLIASVGLGVILERKFLDRVTLGYMARPTKYFYSRTQGGIAPLNTPVIVNGNPEPTWTPSGTGIANPNFGVIQGFWAELTLPAGFGLSLNYFLFHTKPFDLSGGCGAAGVPGSNLCTDGAAVGDVRPNSWRVEQWFLSSLDYHHSFWGLSLGISTFRPMQNPDGTLAQPFFLSNRSNYTTVYLSFTAASEALAAYAMGREVKEPH